MAVAVAVVTETAAVVAVAAADQSAEAEGGTFSQMQETVGKTALDNAKTAFDRKAGTWN